MFFVFGWGHQTVKKHGPVQKYRCERCHNEELWHLFSKKTWFTLFFIPVIPYARKYLLLCPVCNHGVELDHAQFLELKQVAECNMELINQRISPDEHAERMKQLAMMRAGGNQKMSEEASLEGKTETQRNYLRQMREIEEERARKQSLES